MISQSAKTIIGVTIVAALGVSVFFQHGTIARLRQQMAALEYQLQAGRERAPVRGPELPTDTNELIRLRAQESELIKLRGEVTMLRRERDSLSNQFATIKTKTFAGPMAQNVNTGWVQQVLESSPAQQGLAAGTLRGKMVRGEGSGVSSSEMALQKALIQRQLNQTLERTPQQFADFQTAFIQGTLGISDAGKLQQVHELIRQTYEHAVANGLDIPSKPTADADGWVQRRYQLDRRATNAVQQLFTPEERQLFDRAFLGVMGVDLGGGEVDKSNYPRGVVGP